MWNITSRQRPRVICANLEMIFMWQVALHVTNINVLLPVGAQNTGLEPPLSLLFHFPAPCLRDLFHLSPLCSISSCDSDSPSSPRIERSFTIVPPLSNQLHTIAPKSLYTISRKLPWINTELTSVCRCCTLSLLLRLLPMKSFKELTKYSAFLLRAECSKLKLTGVRRHTTSFMINDKKPMGKTCDALTFENFKCIQLAPWQFFSCSLIF